MFLYIDNVSVYIQDLFWQTSRNGIIKNQILNLYIFHLTVNEISINRDIFTTGTCVFDSYIFEHR